MVKHLIIRLSEMLPTCFTWYNLITLGQRVFNTSTYTHLTTPDLFDKVKTLNTSKFDAYPLPMAM